MIAWVESPPGTALPDDRRSAGRSTTGAALSDIVTVADFAGCTAPLVSMTGTERGWSPGRGRWNPGFLELAGVNAQFGAFPTDCEANATTLCLTGGRFERHRDLPRSSRPRRRRAGGGAHAGERDVLVLHRGERRAHPQGRRRLRASRLPGLLGLRLGLTDVEVTLTVVDTWTGEVWERETALGEPFPPVLDSQAFHTCDALPSTGPVAPKEGGCRCDSGSFSSSLGSSDSRSIRL